MAKTEIKLGVNRTIKTADFESLHISAEIKEEIEWADEGERTLATDQVVNHLISDFTKSYKAITASVGVKRSLGTGKLENKKTGQTHTANVEADSDEVDIF
ncbi:unnamed protein product [marine sediment metagenome]|uniref:Uncharacterized protein n=1 Tax=marine sediment metagenome TaxID=412755 RepID=X0T5Y9_9ZZZZ